MKELLASCLGILIIICIFSLLGGYILMLLWNWLAPLFWTSAPVLTFWQAWGISVLLSIIGNKFRSTNSSNK